ncbi:hypothetical protein ACFXAZ_38940 [Streptomyces sp. NPDC059477]|uniref:hypothetical protein n=1 Tax=Streptomyces sp. NPDC059477 TaxID=3346847 RepID=UPI0036C09A51
MTGTGWEWHDSGSGPGPITARQTAHRAYFDHVRTCPVCAADSETCNTAQTLWEAYTAQTEGRP